MFDRTLAGVCFVIAVIAGVGAALLALFNFLDWLTTGTFDHPSLLQIAYDTHVIKARWFLAHQWSWGIHDVLQRIPLGVALCVSAPLAWWGGMRFARR